MKYLATLNPAQIIVLKEGDKAFPVDLLKPTLLDLLLKQVLRIEKNTRQASANDPVISYDYVCIGPAFYDYKYNNHELVYLSPFFKNAMLQVLFRKLVKMGYENAYKGKKYSTRVAESFDLKPYIKRNIFQWILGGLSLTAAGLLARDEVNAEIAALEQKLINADSEARKELVKPIYGNIMLLQGLPDGMFAEFDAIIGEAVQQPSNEGGYTGCAGCGWIGFDSYSDGFDSGCGGHGSGCGGHSGCGGSGCSGCGGGGCGGCGGGD